MGWYKTMDVESYRTISLKVVQVVRIHDMEFYAILYAYHLFHIKTLFTNIQLLYIYILLFPCLIPVLTFHIHANLCMSSLSVILKQDTIHNVLRLDFTEVRLSPFLLWMPWSISPNTYFNHFISCIIWVYQ